MVLEWAMLFHPVTEQVNLLSPIAVSQVDQRCAGQDILAEAAQPVEEYYRDW